MTKPKLLNDAWFKDCPYRTKPSVVISVLTHTRILVTGLRLQRGRQLAIVWVFSCTANGDPGAVLAEQRELVLGLQAPRRIGVVEGIQRKRSHDVATVRRAIAIQAVVHVQLQGVFRDDVQRLKLVQTCKSTRLLQPVRHGRLADHQCNLAVRLLDQNLAETIGVIGHRTGIIARPIERQVNC